MTKYLTFLSAGALLFALFTLPADAQIGFNGMEVTGMGGAAYRSQSGSSWLAGGSVGGALSPYVLLYGQGSYSHLPGQTLDLGPSVDFTAGSGNIVEGHGGVQFQYPIPETRIAPFVGFGMGVVHSTYEASGTILGGTDPFTGLPLPDITESVSREGTSLAYTIPFGLRYYVGERWGVRPEVAAVSGGDITTFYRFSIGIFFQSGR